MRLIATRRLEPGCLLGRDVSDGRAGTIPLLRAGVTLTERHRSALLGAGIHAIYVNDELGEGIDVREAVGPETRRKATEAVGRAVEGARQSYTAGRPIPESVMTDLAAVAEMIARDIEDCADIAVALHDLSSADGYTLQHSIDVAAVGMLLGPQVFQAPRLDRPHRAAHLAAPATPTRAARPRAAGARRRKDRSVPAEGS